MVFYAEYYKCALQVNPFSYAKYRGEAVQNEDVYNDKIVEKCKQCDIRVVGLADHGSVDTTETLRKKLHFQDLKFHLLRKYIWCVYFRQKKHYRN